MSPGLIRILRRARNWAYGLAGPFDYLWRLLNKMPHYPPIRLRRHAGTLGTLDGPGLEFDAYLRLLVGLRPGQKIWDLGCGCGLLELALEHSGWQGRVIGTDIHRPSIKWAERTISARRPGFRFIHADIHHQAYWPQGRLDASQWLSVFDEKDFDLVVAKSFFTHVLPEEMDAYFQAITRRLKPDGKALLTFFILGGSGAKEGSGRPPLIRFRPAEGSSGYAVKNPSAPTAAVAYGQEYLRRKFQAHGLARVGDIRWGWWRGISGGLSFQDIIVVKPRIRGRHPTSERDGIP